MRSFRVGVREALLWLASYLSLSSNEFLLSGAIDSAATLEICVSRALSVLEVNGEVSLCSLGKHARLTYESTYTCSVFTGIQQA